MSVIIPVAGTNYTVPSSAADVNWAADQVAFEQAIAAAVNAASEETWVAVALAGSWDGSPQISKSPAGRINFRAQGGVDGGSTPLLCTLPAAYWPATQPARFVVPCGSPSLGLFCLMTVNPGDGTVILDAMTGTNQTDVYAATDFNVSWSTT
jgi:hypothetical protein